ncbi:hypothetical protein JOL79_31730 [Microbispora sp. RL4-1S]|uniref:Uncharacterized protein n=1 Tax=Microbispora oryzae TaxID=2806554 RepID=A0A941ASH6_9ACTN|nr:hypothetical protein [Microbispora oryzae]MBP2708359.1 hypothetical protein [Microbispora oryzae]
MPEMRWSAAVATISAAPDANNHHPPPNAGTVTVTATIDGKQATSSYDAPYPAAACH